MNSLQYTIRGLTPGLDESLRRLAKQRGQSLNSVVLELLKAGIRTSNQPRAYKGLDDLFGVMSVAEAQELNHSSQENRTIPPKDWE